MEFAKAEEGCKWIFSRSHYSQIEKKIIQSWSLWMPSLEKRQCSELNLLVSVEQIELFQWGNIWWHECKQACSNSNSMIRCLSGSFRRFSINCCSCSWKKFLYSSISFSIQGWMSWLNQIWLSHCLYNTPYLVVMETFMEATHNTFYMANLWI